MFLEGKFHRHFTNFTLDGGTFVTVLGVLKCVKLCMNTKKCSSFFYSPIVRSCQLSPKRYYDTTELAPQEGTNYHSMRQGFRMQCSSTADCFYQNSVCTEGSCLCVVGHRYQSSERICVRRFAIACMTAADCPFQDSHCIGARCECNVGLSYNLSKKSCVKKCTDYGDVFASFYRHGIAGCNVRALTVNTANDCMRKCIDEASFVCINAEYDIRAKECNLCDTGWLDLPKSKRQTEIGAVVIAFGFGTRGFRWSGSYYH